MTVTVKISKFMPKFMPVNGYWATVISYTNDQMKFPKNRLNLAVAGDGRKLYNQST